MALFLADTGGLAQMPAWPAERLAPPSDPCARGFTLSCGRLMDGRFQSTFSLQGGSIGVRGFFGTPQWCMRTDGSEFQTHGKDLAELVDQGVELLREKGVLRVHVLTSSLRPQETNFWRELGWETCPGEKLFHLHNPTAVQQLRFLPKGYSVGSATPSDIAYLESMVLPVPELAFQNWEFSLISRDLTSSDRYYRVVRYDGRPVGVAVAGRIGSTATFSHVWVCKKERHHGLGGHLVSSIVGEMAADGVKHIYLMTTPGNDVASEFWKRKGFCEIPGRGFLERDIEKKREKL